MSSSHLRRRLPLVTLMVLLAALVAGTAAAQQPGERVIMTPADGTLSTRFVFAGSGFAPGRIIAVRFYSPDGLERRLRTDDGVEFVWLVGVDGTFALDLIPAQRFPGAPAGRWRALFCTVGSSTCQQIEFDLPL